MGARVENFWKEDSEFLGLKEFIFFGFCLFDASSVDCPFFKKNKLKT